MQRMRRRPARRITDKPAFINMEARRWNLAGVRRTGRSADAGRDRLDANPLPWLELAAAGFSLAAASAFAGAAAVVWRATGERSDFGRSSGGGRSAAAGPAACRDFAAGLAGFLALSFSAAWGWFAALAIAHAIPAAGSGTAAPADGPLAPAPLSAAASLLAGATGWLGIRLLRGRAGERAAAAFAAALSLAARTAARGKDRPSRPGGHPDRPRKRERGRVRRRSGGIGSSSAANRTASSEADGREGPERAADRRMGPGSDEAAGLGRTERMMMDNIRAFAATTAREIMIPRTEMVCLQAERPFAENRAIALVGRHTRYPVCAPDKDHIIGYVHIKDLLFAGEEEPDLGAIMRPIMRVPETAPISRLLGRMQENGTPIALVVDEYGGTAGLVTAEDIVEEIVGEMRDEFDPFRPAIVERDDRTFSVDGLLHIEEFNAFFGTAIDSDELETIGGWMHANLDVLPPGRGQSVPCGDYRLVVEEVDRLRISRLLVCRAENAGEWKQDVS